jgi:hypothetical protein
MQHFGLYFDQWNDQGAGALSNQEFNGFSRKCETDPVLEDILPSKKIGFLDSDIGEIQDSLSTRKTMLAGILAAVKEANLKKRDLNIFNRSERVSLRPAAGSR